MLTYQMPGFGTGSMTVSNEAPLNVVSFGLSQLFSWALGCGVHRLELQVVKQRLGISISMTPLVEPGVIQAANCSTMKSMLDWKLVPADIPQIERMNIEGNQGFVWDGQARFTFDKGQGMLVQTYDTKPSLTVAEWAFAYSDHVTGFIWRGVKTIKIYYSMKLTQTHLTPELPQDVVRAMMTHAEDYPQNTLVSSIK